LLALIATLALAALFHECGHAAACAYGGARPGPIGMGIYLLFPVFYTDVTDSYRLDRAGRIRTDLGGLYFNVWCVVVLNAAFLASHNGLLLLAVLLLHLEMAQQLIPTVRFDGYFVLADLAGVPDLFARVRPVLISLVPGRPTDPRVRALRPAARRIVVGWVVLVVPVLTLGCAWLLYSLPLIVRQVLGGVAREARAMGSAWRSVDIATLLLAALSIVLLCVPLLGLAELARQIVLRVTRAARAPIRSKEQPRHGTGGRRSPSEEGTTMPNSENEPADGLTADALTDDSIFGTPRVVPETGWRRAVLSASGGAVNLGPGAAERHRAEMLARITAPISGSRRVVVMSRKGGVGKPSTPTRMRAISRIGPPSPVSARSPT
jgi:putative peptide zinc metalloprotease protein